jgi:hypothetical protein
MKIPFVGGTHQARSLNASAQRSVNCFLELDNDNPRAPVALYGTPGTTLQLTFPTGPVRGCIKMGLFSFWVAGSSVYRVSKTLGVTKLGTITSNAGSVGMAANDSQVLIVDGFGGWLATATGLAPITDVDFPIGVTKAGYVSSYFVVAGDGSGQFFWSETPNSGADWNGLDFASAEANPDRALSLNVDHLEVQIFGANTVERFTLTGDADLPFQRSGNTFVEHGLAAADAVAKLDNTTYWLAQDERGGPMVMRLQGYTPQRVSDHALEKAIQGYAVVDDAFAYSYQIEGHSFYVLTFPTANATWFFDVESNRWFEWAWRHPATGALHRHRSSCHLFFSGQHLVGDFESGNVYALGLDTFTDNGDPILRVRTTQTMSEGNKRLFFGSLVVDMETGVGLVTGQGEDPRLMLRYSNDGGHSWSNVKTATVGRIGEYGARAKFGPSGSGRNRVWEISMSDPVKFAVFGADVDAEAGE